MFGCKTVLFKMDKDGNCVCVKRTNIATVRDLPMHGWTDTQFRRMAVSSNQSTQLTDRCSLGATICPPLLVSDSRRRTVCCDASRRLKG